MFLAAATPPPAFDAVVVKVSDGDTINVVIPGNPQEFKIRLACIDSPEPRQLGGGESSANLKAILPIGTVVQIWPVAPNDRYNRTIAFVIAGERNSNLEQERNINLAQVMAGQAWFDPQYARTCPQYAPLLIEAQNEAELNEMGLWRSKNPKACAPWDFRSNKCVEIPDCKPVEN